MLLAAHEAYLNGRSAAVMSVGNVKITDFFEILDQTANGFFVVDDPDTVDDAIVGCKVNYRFVFHDFSNNAVDILLSAVGQEDGTRVGVAGIHMLNAVLLFILTGKLVFFNGVVQILVDGRTGDQAYLASAVHNKLIKIKARRFILSDDPAVIQLLKVLGCLLIHKGIVHIHAVIQGALRTIDSQKRVILAVNGSSRFLTIIDIVRKGCHISGFFRNRTNGFKGSYSCHIAFSLSLF
ncbi:hypothetical protein SDC9_160944 [bioreactor metagenome]|uniref:Uncharacterized protein n=1 Tax=bioreactor metagenome TaxID=1076179 RepID=A0A645FJB4_9ZZZZ